MSGNRRAHPHWLEKVHQRIGPDVDGHALFRRIIRSIDVDDGWARFKARQHDDKRIFLIEIDGREFAVVVAACPRRGTTPITVLDATWMIPVGRKGKLKRLRAVGWERLGRPVRPR